MIQVEYFPLLKIEESEILMWFFRKSLKFLHLVFRCKNDSLIIIVTGQIQSEPQLNPN